MTALTGALPPSAARARSAPANVLTIARRELRDAVRSRWFLLYTLAFAALGLGVSYLSAVASGGSGLAGFGRTTAGLVNLVLLVIPLMALTAGAGTIAGDRERGMLAYLAAQPVSRTEILLGKYAGLAGALLACLCLGYGACAAVLAVKGEPVRVAGLAVLVGLSMGLALSMLSIGVLVSVVARKASVAVGTAVFTWLMLVFVSDLGLMAGALAMRLRVEQLLALSVLNPLQVFKMWSLHAVDANLDVLGPAGLYAQEEYGARLHPLFGGCLAAWTALPLALAAFIFSRKAPV
ncbi:MAG: ABC transporter permease [Thermoleophilia bacterium]|nr:ABC transporter permease [Thermoleophilia bacterium]